MSKKVLFTLLMTLLSASFYGCSDSDPSLRNSGTTDHQDAVQLCGNSTIDGNEECDKTVYKAGKSNSCADWDSVKTSGSVSCDSTCHVITTSCTEPTENVTCNRDGQFDSGEECDGTAFPSGKSSSCADWDNTNTVGTVTCDNNCHVVKTSCTAPPQPETDCSALENSFGEIGHTKHRRSGGRAEKGIPTENAGLDKLLAKFSIPDNDAAWIKEAKKQPRMDLSSSPIHIDGAVVVAAEAPSGTFKNIGHFYIQDKSGTLYVRTPDSAWSGLATPKVGDKVSFDVTEITKYYSNNQISKISNIQVSPEDNASTKVYYTDLNETEIANVTPGSIVHAVGVLSGEKACGGNGFKCYTLTTKSKKTMTLRVKGDANPPYAENACAVFTGPLDKFRKELQLNSQDNANWASSGASPSVTPGNKCGNGSVDAGEECDGTAFQSGKSNSCADWDSTNTVGTVTCDNNCHVVKTSCTASAPPVGSCSALESFFGEIGDTTPSGRGGGQAVKGTPTEDAGLGALSSKFTEMGSKNKYDVDPPIQITNAVVSATETPFNSFTNNGHFYIQDRSGGMYVYLNDKVWNALNVTKIPKVGDKISFKVTQIGQYSKKRQITGISEVTLDSSNNGTTNVYYTDLNEVNISSVEPSTIVHAVGTLSNKSTNKGYSTFTLTTTSGKTINVFRVAESLGYENNQCAAFTGPLDLYKDKRQLNTQKNEKWAKK